MFEIEENTLDELPYSITCLQFACLAYEAAPENVNSMRHLECSMDDTYEAAESALACYCDLISPHDYGDNSECFTYTAELEKISSRRQTIDVLLSCGNLTPAEEERLSELRKEIAAKDAVLDQLSRESSKPNQNVASQRDILQSQLNDVNARISAVVDYASVRNELLFKALHTPNVEFQLYDVVKKTGELVPAWKLRYRGTIYQCLSRSEKILAGLEVVELLKRLTGRCYPVFIDDSESVDHIPRPSGQALISKKVADQPLKVQVKNTSMNLPKAG